MSENRLLVVDDDTAAAELLKDILQSHSYEVALASSVSEAMEHLRDYSFKVLVTDLKMPGDTGMILLDYCGKHFQELPVIMMTAYATIQNAVSALKKGAFDFITKPVQIDELLIIIEKAISHGKLINENQFLRKEVDRLEAPLYKSENKQMQDVYVTIGNLREINSTVLLQGETGTGKEVVARYIHRSSDRASGAFVPINCGAIPENLIETELFGYEKGAFTDARDNTKGKLEIADGGTLFLDEINELPYKAQVALLRFLQEREISPVGSTRKVKLDVRIVAATNTDLQLLIREKTFREDLFYRINVFPLSLPPLRSRREDIIPLANWFLGKFRLEYNRHIKGFSEEAIAVLKSYSWPGNIRELRNCVERAVIIEKEPLISCRSFLMTDAGRSGDFDFKAMGMATLKEVEDSYIRWVLDQLNGSKSKAAERLGISVRGLRYKLDQNEKN